MRLIDAEKLKRILKYCAGSVIGEDEYFRGVKHGLISAAELVDEAATVDTVKQGGGVDE